MIENINVSIEIDGNRYKDPLEVFDFGVVAVFDDERAQPSLDIESITLVRDARKSVLKWVEEGKSGGIGIFEGLPYTIRVSDSSKSVNIFNGFIDATTEFVDNPTSGRLVVKIGKQDGLLELSERLAAINFGNLVENGFLTDSDYQKVGYVVQKPFNLEEQLSNATVFYLVTRELASLIKDLGKDTATSSGIASSSVTGVVGAGVHATIAAAIQAIYTATIAILVFRLANKLKNTYSPPKREHKTLSLRKGLTAIAKYLGYEFESSIEELDNLHLLASNTNYDQSTLDGLIGKVGSIEKGIPDVTDYGYSCAEYFTLAKEYFNASTVIRDGVIYLEWNGSEFFKSQSSTTLPDVLNQPYSYNTDDAIASKLFAFQTDITDLWTIENYKGTNYQVLLEPIVINDPKNVRIRGFKQTNFNVALGNRKDELNALENTLSDILGTIDSLLNTLGGAFGVSSNFANTIKSKIGLLKVSTNNHTIPKLLWLENGKLPKDHREKLSAKASYNKYQSWGSFVTNPNESQRKTFDSIDVKFTFDQFVKTINNAYIFTPQGVKAKYTRIEWKMLQGRAKASYYIAEKYTDNLKETFIEP